MNRCHDTRIGQVSNGLVLKIGCKIFIGQSKDLEQLAVYYGGNIPEKFKKYVDKREAFIRDEPCDEACCEKACEKDGTGLPGFISIEGANTVIKASNGFILVKQDSTAWIAKDKKALMAML